MTYNTWQKNELGKSLKLTSGFPFLSKLFSTEDGFPLIRIRDIVGSKIETFYKGSFLPQYVIKSGDILIGMDGDFNISRWNNEDALLNQRVLKVEVNDPTSLSLDFIYYWLQPYIKKVNDLTAATTVKHLSVKDLYKASGTLPEVHTQQKIATILSTIDTAIEKTEALITKYQQIKAGLMHDLFTRGVLPNGQLRPSHEQAPELYQETAIGWIPIEWEVKGIIELASVIDPNPSHRNPIYHEDGFPFISTVEFIEDDQVEVDTPRRVIEEIVIEQERRCKFSGDSIAFSRKGTIGSTRFLPNHLRFALLDSLCVINPTNIAPSFLFNMLRSASIQKQTKNMTVGQALPQMSIGRVRELQIPTPQNPAEQAEIGARLTAVSNYISKNHAELKKLQKKKHGLMQDLLTGKVPVSVEEPEPAHE
ncbi:restriction endonuclease subunit S [Endozoicomonas sp.]|uniref:restriction endonuclease subunit S n=1 Tax=Endozoicomonas sp. TaxID=1892382 RepID=UPI003AF46E22